MISVLLAYSTVDGHTLAVANRIRSVLESSGHAVTLMPVEQALSVDCTAFDKVLLGASIRYGKHRDSVYDFVARNRQALSSVPSAFFSVSAVARKKGKDVPDGNPYFRKFTRRSGWNPQLGAAFAGKIDYPKYGVADRLVIQLIMWITKGPTDPNASVDFTDWEQVTEFAARFGSLPVRQ